MDLLSSGSDRPPRRPLAALRGWRPAGAVVAAQAALVVVVAVSAVLSLGPVRERVELAGLEVRVLSSTVAVRGPSTDGVLRVALANRGPRPVDVRSAELDLPGVELLLERARTPRRLAPGDDIELDVPFRVPVCSTVAASGVVRLGVTVDGRAPRVLELPVTGEPPDRGIDAAALTAGCRPTSTPYVVALAVEGVSGRAQGAGGTARGELLIEVRNAGAAVRLVSVTGEVPGVLFVSQTDPARNRDTLPGERVSVPLPFVVPFCGDSPPRRGRLVVTVRDAAGVLRTVAFPADNASGVDLTLVFGACRAPG